MVRPSVKAMRLIFLITSMVIFCIIQHLADFQRHGFGTIQRIGSRAGQGAQAVIGHMHGAIKIGRACAGAFDLPQQAFAVQGLVFPFDEFPARLWGSRFSKPSMRFLPPQAGEPAFGIGRGIGLPGKQHGDDKRNDDE